MRSRFIVALLLPLFALGIALAQAGFPSSSSPLPNVEFSGTTVFRCQQAVTPFTDCAYGSKVYSQTATMTIATPAVVSSTSHGLIADSPVVFTTTGALPTGVTAGTTYYVLATGLNSGTFRFSTSAGGAAVNTSGSQSGTHTLWYGVTIASKFQSAALTTNPAVTQIQLVLQGPASGSTILTGVTICPSASSGTTALWSCSATPTAFAFNGSAAVTVASNIQQTSDTVAFAMSAAQAYTVAFDVSPQSTGAYMATMSSTRTTPSSSAASFVAYCKRGVAEATTQTRGASYITSGQCQVAANAIMGAIYRIIRIP